MLRLTNQVLNTPVRKQFLGLGNEEVTANTLNLMKDIIIKSSQNYYVRRWAEKIMEGCNRCPLERAQTLFYFLVNNTEYQKDPHGFELLKTPVVSLQLMEMGDIPQLDCDDFVILSLSLLKSLGYPVAMRAIAIRSDQELTHVYGLTFILGQWYSIDLTKPEMGFGWEYDKATKVVNLVI